MEQRSLSSFSIQRDEKIKKKKKKTADKIRISRTERSIFAAKSYLGFIFTAIEPVLKNGDDSLNWIFYFFIWTVAGHFVRLTLYACGMEARHVYRYVRYLYCTANGVWMAVIKWYGFRMLTKLHPLQVENQLENNNTVWRMTRCNIRARSDILHLENFSLWKFQKLMELYSVVLHFCGRLVKQFNMADGFFFGVFEYFFQNSLIFNIKILSCKLVKNNVQTDVQKLSWIYYHWNKTNEINLLK